MTFLCGRTFSAGHFNRLDFSCFGRYSTKNETKTAEDNRVNIKYDAHGWFGDRLRYFNTPRFKWALSAGPAYLMTDYYDTSDREQRDQVASFETSRKLEYKFSRLNKIKFDDKFSVTDEKYGSYKHHLVLKFETDIAKDRIFIDTSSI